MLRWVFIARDGNDAQRALLCRERYIEVTAPIAVDEVRVRTLEVQAPAAQRAPVHFGRADVGLDLAQRSKQRSGRGPTLLLLFLRSRHGLHNARAQVGFAMSTPHPRASAASMYARMLPMRSPAKMHADVAHAGADDIPLPMTSTRSVSRSHAPEERLLIAVRVLDGDRRAQVRVRGPPRRERQRDRLEPAFAICQQLRDEEAAHSSKASVVLDAAPRERALSHDLAVAAVAQRLCRVGEVKCKAQRSQLVLEVLVHVIVFVCVREGGGGSGFLERESQNPGWPSFIMRKLVLLGLVASLVAGLPLRLENRTSSLLRINITSAAALEYVLTHDLDVWSHDGAVGLGLTDLRAESAAIRALHSLGTEPQVRSLL
jgi:hypothetical protein